MRDVSVFVPCIIDLFLPSIGEATISLLRRLGVNPIYHREQTCCGQPAFNSGYRREATRMAKHFIQVFQEAEVIVSPSGSCVCMVKNNYQELFCNDQTWFRRAEELSPRIYELSEYIVDVLGIEDVGASFPGKVAYHECCHVLRGLEVSEQPKKLIRAVEGTELVAMNWAETCCGFGGEFANDYPEISEAMVREKVENYEESEADLLVLCEPGCLLNIGGYLSRNRADKKIIHIASFLAGYPTQEEKDTHGD
jgi:L-lactate dehydrogenase complex protein LldE